uniref:Uncharacterized protein n=1 Tax=Panagrolaimus sp. JU765 TaxID=591449 RepID=A0AC34Q0N0_9BILA
MENPGGLRKEKIFITRKECVVPNAHMLDYYFPVTPFLPPEIKPEDASILDFINLKALFDQERLPIVSAYYYPYHGLTATPDSERDSHGIRFDKDEIRQYYSTPKEAYVPPPNNKTFHQFDQPGVSEAINGFFLLCDVISIICIILAVKPELAKTFCDSFKPYRPASYNNFRQTSL